MLLRLAAGIVCVAAYLPCQEGESDVRSAEAQRRIKTGVAGEKGEKGEVEDEKLTPEQRMARNITSGAQAFCRFLMTVNPPKLMPGQSGTVKILATLQGNAVIPSPAPFEMVTRPQQGAISLGALAFQPASPGRLASGYLGRPVYDNYAVIEIPVTMSPTATLGSKHIVEVDMKFDLYDGVSTQPIGRFLDRSATEVEVGQVLDPEVKGVARRPVADEAPKQEAPPPEPPRNPDVRATPAPPPLQGNAVPAPAKPAVEPEPVAAPQSALPTEDQGGDLPLPLMLGGGALLLVAILLMSRRK